MPVSVRMDGVSRLEHPLCRHLRDAEATCDVAQAGEPAGDVLLVLHVGQQPARSLVKRELVGAYWFVGLFGLKERC